MKILVVEDEQFSRTMLSGYVSKLGHEVLEAGDGDEAWHILENEHVPLIITDWMMPGTDGLALIEKIRSTRHRSYVYIILVTSKAEKRDVVEGIMAGADDFLTKPYDVDELRVRIRAGERIVQLEERLSARNVELNAAKEKLEESHRRMKDDLEAAAKIQQSLLPTTVPQNERVECAWILRPCDELAGDSLNILQLDKHRAALFVFDVEGHGVQSSLLSVAVTHALLPKSDGCSLLFPEKESRARELLASPSVVAERLNNFFQLRDETDRFFTLVYGILDNRDRSFTYTSAGHPGPIHSRRGEFSNVLQTLGPPIGVVDGMSYEEERVDCQAGDRLILYSDGLYEEMNGDEQFGHQRLIDLVDGSWDCELPDALESLERAVRDWCPNESLSDDLSLLAAQWT